MQHDECKHGTRVKGGVHPVSKTSCDDDQPFSNPDSKEYGAREFEGVWAGHGKRVPGAKRPDGRGKMRCRRKRLG